MVPSSEVSIYTKNSGKDRLYLVAVLFWGMYAMSVG